ncbi:Hypp9221 [Branchiostoma lanceolatum]|uniref:Hypp9221 protein n=1 Tax=Branchiostoma lanceolatum TaxID=7740 RepID=A0A8K0EIC8_BRALA|nr:Hypp9221 [Branchiostoma lanceolatum]
MFRVLVLTPSPGPPNSHSVQPHTESIPPEFCSTCLALYANRPEVTPNPDAPLNLTPYQKHGKGTVAVTAIARRFVR